MSGIVGLRPLAHQVREGLTKLVHDQILCEYYKLRLDLLRQNNVVGIPSRSGERLMEMVEHLVLAPVIFIHDAQVHVIVLEGESDFRDDLVHHRWILTVKHLSLSGGRCLKENVLDYPFRTYAERPVDNTSCPLRLAVREEHGWLGLLPDGMTGLIVKFGEEIGKGFLVPELADRLVLMEQRFYCAYRVVKKILDNTPEVCLASVGEQMAFLIHHVFLLNHLFTIQADHLTENSFERAGHVTVTKRLVALPWDIVSSVADDQAIPLGKLVAILYPAITVNIFSDVR